MSEITLTKTLENLCSVPFEMQVTAYLKRNPGVPKVDAERIIEERAQSIKSGAVLDHRDKDLQRLTAFVRIPGVVNT